MAFSARQHLVSISIFASGLCMVSALAAAEKQPCSQIPDDAERLACYDKTFPPGPFDKAVVAAASAKNFGKSEKKSTASSIQSGVVSIKYLVRNQRQFTLDNGQIWYETDKGQQVNVKVGDQITIKDAALSSYLLITPGGASIRVKRLK
jgi:hypothetical protein